MHGQGTFTWADGKKYEGEYRQDKKEGYGKYYWDEQKYFTGYWIGNKQHGEGIYYSNGNVIKLQFRFGKIIAKQKVEDSNSNSENNNKIPFIQSENKESK